LNKLLDNAKYSIEERKLAADYLNARKKKSAAHEIWTHEDEVLCYYSFLDGFKFREAKVDKNGNGE